MLENNKKPYRPENIEKDKTYWKSFEELENTPEYQAALQTEFMSSPLRDEFKDEDYE